MKPWMSEQVRKLIEVARAGVDATALGLRRVGPSGGIAKVGALALLGSGVWAVGHAPPVVGIEPGEVAVRVNRLTGSVSESNEGWILAIPGLHHVHLYSLKDKIFRPSANELASGEGAFQSVEGLRVGVAVTVRYALDPARVASAAQTLPDDLDHSLVEPMVDGVLHRVIAQHTVREIFSTERQQIQGEMETALKPLLAQDGVLLRAIFVGNVDLPAEYQRGLEALLGEELASEKMRYTLELKEKEVQQTALEGDADKVKRSKAAEAAFDEEISQAKAKEEAMKHILPFKEKEIEQRRLESEANKVARISEAEATAEARRIEAGGEADGRRKLADALAYQVEVTGKAESEQLARDAVLISQNPLLIQKTLADKLSDKISVIIAPPQSGGFIAGNLLGNTTTAVAQQRGALTGQAQAMGDSLDPARE